MIDQIILGTLGAILVNQVFASFVHRTAGRSWPRLTIIMAPPKEMTSPGQNRIGGRRATDKTSEDANYATQRELLLKRACDAAVSSSGIPAASLSKLGSAEQKHALKAGGATWTGWRKVPVDHCRDESPDCRSIRLVPLDGDNFPNFRAG